MSRPLRVSYAGAWYHILNRGRRKEKIFFSNKDREIYLRLLQKAIKRYQIEVHAYCLMSNHYHLLLRTPKGNISKVMGYIDGFYTQTINKKYKIDGSLFKGRYKSILVGGENYLKKMVQYIHMNPVKAGLCSQPEDYKWTSHRIYLDKEKGDWVETEFILSQFGDSKKEATTMLDIYIKTDENDNEVLAKLEKRRWPALLGNEDFKNKIKDILQGKRLSKKKMWQDYPEVINKISADDILRVLYGCGIKEEDIYRSRRGLRGAGRTAFIYLSKNLRNKTCKEIALEFGDIGPKAVSKQYTRAEKEIENRKGCYWLVEKVEKRLK